MDWKFPPGKEKGFLFLGFVAAARNKKMQMQMQGKKGEDFQLTVIPLFRDLSDAAFFSFVQSPRLKAKGYLCMEWKGRSVGQGTVAAVLCGRYSALFF